MSILRAIRQTVKGGFIIADWLGHGGETVPALQADGRAKCCVGCPENVAPLWWEKSKGSIAQAMKDMLAIKNECDIQVAVEEKLHVCKVCGCCNRLSVWAPIEHIKKHTSSEEIRKYPSHCWKPKELLNL